MKLKMMIREKNMSEFEERNQNNKLAIISDAEKYCLELIREFLAAYSFEHTVTALHVECLQRGLASTVRITKEHAQNILECFENRQEAKFFHLWESLIPASLHETIDYKKLTFYLHVHFAVLPIRDRLDGKVINNNNNKGQDFYIEIDDGVETFILIKEDSTNDGTIDETEEDSVDQGGSEDRELSLVDEGTESSIEQEESRMKKGPVSGMERFRDFLETKGKELSAEPELLSYYALPLVSNPTNHPSFIELFKENWVDQVSQSLHAYLTAHIVSMNASGKLPRLLQLIRSDGRQLNRRFQRLHRDHHHLIGLASELTNALERSVQGHAVDLKVTLDKCARVYPELFVPQTEKPQVFELDYNKIKLHLSSGSAKTRLLLLQALRWRITRSPPIDRGLILHNYARHDLLSLHLSPSPLLVSFFYPENALTPHPLQQGAARLVNTFASLRSGRDYLAANVTLLDVLVPCLMEEKDIKIDGYTSDMLLAALQKLSLRHRLRLSMIHAGVVEWLIHRLALKTISTYTLEYGCALLMNLCLHNEAKERCIPLAEQVLKLLARHLGARLPYVNGTLYSLLADKKINTEAKRMGLSSVLEYHLKNSEGEMHKQFEYIIKLHQSGSTDQSDQNTLDEESDDTEEMDLLEDELDASDPVPAELNGEDLLYQHYRLVFPPCAQGVVHRAPTDLPLVRPTTPRAHRTTPLSENKMLETVTENPSQEQESPPIEDCRGNEKSTKEATPSPRNKMDEYACGFDSRPMIPRTPT